MATPVLTGGRGLGAVAAAADIAGGKAIVIDSAICNARFIGISASRVMKVDSSRCVTDNARGFFGPQPS
jgi:hypothetical protein